MRPLLRIVLNPVVIISALALGIFLTVALLAALWLSKPEQIDQGASTAVVEIIRVPTATPTSTPVPEAVVPTETLLSSTAEPGIIRVGGYVEVTGTGGAGLRIRQNPGLSQGVLFLADEGEVLYVMEGPQSLDGYDWWRLQNPADESRGGWAVADYLRDVPAP